MTLSIEAIIVGEPRTTIELISGAGWTVMSGVLNP